MKKLTSLLALFFLLAVLVTPSTAQESSITDSAASNSSFSILTAALNATGLDSALDGGGPYTVFAPTDAAFNALLSDMGISGEDLLADTALVRRVLRYHVVRGNFAAADVIAAIQENGGAYYVNTLAGDPIKLALINGNVYVNDSQVIITDVFASNGVIHAVDEVLMPPPNIPGVFDGVQILEDDFFIIDAALDAAGLTDTLRGGNYTVFAPSDAAFGRLLSDLGLSAEQLLSNTELLTEVLLYHVVRGEYLSQDLVASLGDGGSTSVSTLNGAPVTVSVDGFNVGVNAVPVSTPNILASNGVVHRIDTVLLPPMDASTTDSDTEAD